MSLLLSFLRDRLTMIGMDPVSGMLSAHRGRDAYLLRCSMEPPWSVRIADASTVSLIVMAGGRMVIARPGEEPAWLTDGDVAVVKTVTPYLLASDLETPPHVVVEPGQNCLPLDDGPGLAYRQGLRTWGNSPDGGACSSPGSTNFPARCRGGCLNPCPGCWCCGPVTNRSCSASGERRNS